MATKANPGKYDCYAKAEPDEPMFILLARDRHAATLVWLWAALRELDGEHEVANDARKECSDMLAWACEHGRKGVGIGQSALVAVMELIRMANFAVDKVRIDNVPTNEVFLRALLAGTVFEVGEGQTTFDPLSNLRESMKEAEAKGDGK